MTGSLAGAWGVAVMVALAALLSENFVLVSCMGIGTRLRAFQDPIDALRYE